MGANCNVRQVLAPLGYAARPLVALSCYPKSVMSIPNVKRYRITSPDGTMSASLMAVLPKDVDVNKYLSEAAQRFDWKAHQDAIQKQFKVRVGQQKQKKAK